jgi:small GTP-binding protein
LKPEGYNRPFKKISSLNDFQSEGRSVGWGRSKFSVISSSAIKISLIPLIHLDSLLCPGVTSGFGHFPQMSALPDTGVPRDARPSVKVILVGPSGVGKTCLIASYLKQNFENRTSPTVAPAFSSHTVRRRDGKVVVLQIWDTAGQERYSSVSQLFFRDSDVALVCFDPDDKSSMTGVKEWIPRILDEVPDCRLFGVMTKSDKHEQSQLEKILDAAKQTFADINFEEYFITSAVKREGVDAVFLASAEAYQRAFDAALVARESTGQRCC